MNVNDLFQNALNDGNITAQSANIFKGVTDYGAAIQNALGVPALNVTASEVILVNMLIDDSGSVDNIPGGPEAICSGHNMILDEILKASKRRDNILLLTQYLNGKVLNPYIQLDQAERMDGRNYHANGGTPLYDQSVVFLATVMAKYQEFADIGVPVRSISLIATDGYDEHSVKYRNKPEAVATVVADMIRSDNHIISTMGINNGRIDFRKIFKAMGIEDKWIMTPTSDPKEIGKSFRLFSQSAVSASQNAASFSKAAMGGFGA